MNRSLKQLSLYSVIVSLFATANTQCMLIKNLKNKPALPFFSQKLNNTKIIQHAYCVKSDEQNKALYELTAKMITSKDRQTRDYGNAFIKSLIQKNQAIETATEFATQGIDSAFYDTRELALNIFILLVEKNQRQVFEIATQAAIQASKSDWRSEIDLSVDLLIALMEKDQAVEIATEKAVELTNDIFSYNQGLTLFSALFKKEQAFEIAKKTAEKLTLDTRWECRKIGIKLFNRLVQNDQAFKEAVKVITEREDIVKESALYLLAALARKDQAPKTAITDAIKYSSETEEYGVRNAALYLLEVILQNNQYTCTDVIEAIATSNIQEAFDQLFQQSKKVEELKELEKRHKTYDETHDLGNKPAWKQLDDLSKDIPLCRPFDGEPNPKFTMKQGEEIEFSKAMCQLQADDNGSY